MKSCVVAFALFLSSVSFASAGDGASASDGDGAGSAEASAPTQYMVTLAEYSLEKPIPVDTDEAGVVDFVVGSGAKPAATIQISAYAETESMVQFGKRVRITTGKVVMGKSTTRQTESMEIGTLLRVRIKPHAKGALADIDYSASRLDGDGTDDNPPSVNTTTMQSTQVYELGKQRLLAATTLADGLCILITVREIP